MTLAPRLLQAALLIGGLAAGLPQAATAQAETAPVKTGALRLSLNQSTIEDVTGAEPLPLDDPKAMFGQVLRGLPERVKVYPTENYFYFGFLHDGSRYAGNIRLDASNRDQGKVHFAYFVDLAEWKDQDAVKHELLGSEQGVAVEKLDRFAYRVTQGDKSVVFELNDLSGVKPRPGLLSTEERFIGPVFDESGIRFLLVFNEKLKIFHYLLDETIRPAEQFFPAAATDRILIGKRSGFAFYRDHRIERKILIGVFEGNSRVNNTFDGPFDQLPDNFIEGETLRSAILAVEPSLKGRIDRFGGSPDGQDRYMIAPYLHYRTEDDLQIFHSCAENRTLPKEFYHACFVFEASEPVAASARPPQQSKKRKVAAKKSVRR